MPWGTQNQHHRRVTGWSRRPGEARAGDPAVQCPMTLCLASCGRTVADGGWGRGRTWLEGPGGVRTGAAFPSPGLSRPSPEGGGAGVAEAGGAEAGVRRCGGGGPSSWMSPGRERTPVRKGSGVRQGPGWAGAGQTGQTGRRCDWNGRLGPQPPAAVVSPVRPRAGAAAFGEGVPEVVRSGLTAVRGESTTTSGDIGAGQAGSARRPGVGDRRTQRAEQDLLRRTPGHRTPHDGYQ